MRDVSVRRGAYVDSVTLMQVSRRVSGLDGVQAAIVAMATDLNVDLARGMGFDVPAASPNDMLVAVEADSRAALDASAAEVDAALSAPAPLAGFGNPPPPVTVRAAAARSDATVAIVSTPGRFAFADAVDAVDAGLHVMVFSDNVPLAQEVRLKEYAATAGVLVMGPDCGTAVIGGVGLGFANVVRPGPVGVVAASGTGAQHLMCLLDGVDVGVSHCLGVGGRDLSAAVGGRSTLRALDLLDEDPSTSLIVVLSKPPDSSVAAAVQAHASTLRTPVLFGLLGDGQPGLTTTAATVTAAVGGTWSAPEHWPGAVAGGRAGGHLRGLFVGGTLRDEAAVVLGRVTGAGHTLLDLGDDRFTAGRPHPMIDGSDRLGRLRAAVEDPTTGVLLVDVVLGLGAEDDPAGRLARAVRDATSAGVPVVATVVGTRDDPQGLRAQVAELCDAGAWVFLSNAAAARCALGLLDVGSVS
jgi:FdrA protein